MLVVPPVVGALVAGVTWWHALLLTAWLAAYLAFAAAGLWLRSGRKARYRPPVLVYGSATALLGGALLAARPALLSWGPVYAVLLAVSLAASARRADRSWANDVVTVLAASLMTLVAAGTGAVRAREAGESAWWPPPGSDDPAARLAAVALFAYLLGTVFYVKTMIRDRGRRGAYVASVTYHVVVAVAGTVVDPLLGVVGVLLAVRSAVVPRRWPRLRPALVGAGEVVATIVVAAAVLVVVGVSPPGR
jgi:hypothetical protein